ncbi:MAG: acyltransferase [Lachnospiraceae bacterium]|nr:acyltransferase [Lachnospiraceae bacterium]
MQFSKNNSLALKGLAICMMMFHHLFLAQERFEGFDVNFAPFTPKQVINVAAMFKICVSLFVFVTGYGLFLSYNNLAKKGADRREIGKWCLVRLIKTMSGFWYIYIICFVVTMLTNDMPFDKYYLGNEVVKGTMYVLFDFLGLGHLLGTPTLCGTWWYMGVAIIYILLIPFLFHIKKKTGWFSLLILVILLPRMLNQGYMGGRNALTFMPILILGMTSADYEIFERLGAKLQNIGKLKATLFCWLVAVLGILVSYMLWANFQREEIWGINCNLVPLVFIFLVKYCLISLKSINSFLIFMGKHSMTIFLTHAFLRVTYLNEWIYSRGHFITIYIALFATSLVLAIVLDALKNVVGVDKVVDKICGKITQKTADVGGN